MERVTRRDAIRLAGVGVVTSSALAMEACNASQWIQTVIADLPTVIEIVVSIMNIIGAATGKADAAAIAVAQKAAAEAKYDLDLALSLIRQYQANDKNTGRLGDINNYLTTAQSNLGSILTALHVTDPTYQAIVAAALGSAISVVTYIQALVPPPPTATPARAALKATVPGSVAAIKAAFNVSVTAAGGAQYMVR